jgi:hypothetical protein
VSHFLQLSPCGSTPCQHLQLLPFAALLLPLLLLQERLLLLQLLAFPPKEQHRLVPKQKHPFHHVWLLREYLPGQSVVLQVLHRQHLQHLQRPQPLHPAAWLLLPLPLSLVAA